MRAWVGCEGRIAAAGSAAGSAAEEEAEAGLVAAEAAEAAEADLTAVIATSTTMEGSESTKCPLFRLACLWEETGAKVTSWSPQVLPAPPAASDSPS